MSTTQRELVLAAVANGIGTPRQIGEATGLGLRTVQAAMTRLQRDGLLRRAGIGFEVAPVERGVEPETVGSASTVEHRGVS